ncbi:MAG: helix-turn-helix domain-containing protein [Chloroflexota bacterium]|nr:helix-turn-helix domain-containing protein [Chloroflexota bacterium]
MRSREPGVQELTRIRSELRMSQAELAALAGVSESELAEMEAGERPVPHDLLTELMEELNLKGA